jgi:membrane associated rhomboid family serine protease
VLPIGDDNSRRRTFPFVTYGLVVLNVGVFLVELGQPDPQGYLAQWGATPAQVSTGQSLATLVTSMFLHAGWAHLLGNMLFLFIFGDNVEDAFGHFKYLAFYLVCGVAASLAQVALAPGSRVPSVGASGAISGVLAAYVVMFGNNRVRVILGIFPAVVPAYVMIGLWIVLQFVSGAASLGYTQQSGGVAYGAHVGGFLCGLLLTFLLRPARRQPLRPYDRRR